MPEMQTLLPPNATPLARIVEQVMAERLMGIHEVIETLWDPFRCPLHLLPWLAWALSVDEWDEGWSEDQKRNVIAGSISIHRDKGTLASVKRALASAGYGEVAVVERHGWDFHDGTHIHDGSVTYAAPDHWAEYRAFLTRPITIEQADQVRRILADVAPAHCHLKALDFTEALNTYNARIGHDGIFTHGVA